MSSIELRWQKLHFIKSNTPRGAPVERLLFFLPQYLNVLKWQVETIPFNDTNTIEYLYNEITETRKRLDEITQSLNSTHFNNPSSLINFNIPNKMDDTREASREVS
jgi:hypothetical protein